MPFFESQSFSFCHRWHSFSPRVRQSNAPNQSGPGSDIYSFLVNWDQRALNAQADQPNWLTPVVTSTARLKQEFRYDRLVSAK
jgi:hypothetical protein